MVLKRLGELVDLRLSGVLRWRSTEWPAEPESTGLIRSERFPTAGLDSYTATCRMQRPSLPGRTGLVKWCSHLPGASAEAQELSRRKCPKSSSNKYIKQISQETFRCTKHETKRETYRFKRALSRSKDPKIWKSPVQYDEASIYCCSLFYPLCTLTVGAPHWVISHWHRRRLSAFWLPWRPHWPVTLVAVIW